MNKTVIHKVMDFVDDVDAIAPRHERTNCSDRFLANIHTHNRVARCLRCVLLEAKRTGWGMGLTLEIHISIQAVDRG